MIRLIGRWNALVSDLSLVARCALLSIVLLIAACLAAPVAWLQGGSLSLATAATAAGVCWLAGLVALFLATRGRGTPAAVGWVLAGDGVAMGLPLLSAISLQRSGHWLSAAGYFGWIVVFFLITLVAKTLLVAPLAAGLAAGPGSKRLAAETQHAGKLPEAGV